MAGKAQIVDQLVAGGATRAQAAAAVDSVLHAITASLAAGERVTLTGFGTFEPAERSARTARNPRTGSSVEVAATTVARFRPGTALRAAVASGSAPGVVARPVLGAVPTGGGGAAGAASDVVGASASTSKGKGKNTGKDRDDPARGKHGSAATGEAPAGAVAVVARKAERKADRSTTKASAPAGKKRSKDDKKRSKDEKPSGKDKGKGKGTTKTKGEKDAAPAKSGKKRAKK